jgi:hypothetical protein
MWRRKTEGCCHIHKRKQADGGVRKGRRTRQAVYCIGQVDEGVRHAVQGTHQVAESTRQVNGEMGQAIGGTFE